ncbi:unnamed protein product [Durusdinium trenchii]|uniref:Uncharacterized protein n=1 Tax=Durusdinium trenchii TaxID=1381693 RepID=A0ABP0SWJ1_9DINO
MYSLRGYGGNHLGMFAGTRSDFIITQHPEFHLGRLASEQGLGQQWDTTRCACKTSRSWVMQKIHDSMLNSSERLCGPRAQGVSLKQRAGPPCKVELDITDPTILRVLLDVCRTVQ